MNEVANNHPGLLVEMYPGARQRLAIEKPGLGTFEGNGIHADGPLLTAAMNRFAGKLGLALHYHEAGRPVPSGGAVAVRWFSNVEAVQGGIPESLFELVGPPRTLRQGKFHVDDQFKFGSRASDDGALSAHFASFRFSFATVAFVAEDAADLRSAPLGNRFEPGFLPAATGSPKPFRARLSTSREREPGRRRRAGDVPPRLPDRP
jgi:hypothetical protein